MTEERAAHATTSPGTDPAGATDGGTAPTNAPADAAPELLGGTDAGGPAARAADAAAGVTGR